MNALVSNREALLIQQWRSKVAEYIGNLLERDDQREVDGVREAQGVYSTIQGLSNTPTTKAVQLSLSMLPLYIAHFEELSTVFEASFDHKLSTAALWGVINLLINICSPSAHCVDQLSNMLKAIGRKCELFVRHARSSTEMVGTKECAMDIELEIIKFAVAMINHFRDRSNYESESFWLSAAQPYTACIHQIGEAFDGIERLAQIMDSDLRLKQRLKVQQLLSLTPESFREKAKLPCVMLPATKNTGIFDREDVLVAIDQHFENVTEEDQKPRSLALYGLSGVGKSQTAIKFAQQRFRNNKAEAVLWAYSETATSLAQSFTNFALKLELEGASDRDHEKNKAIVLLWLQQTRAKWLLVFDNAEFADDLLQYWPSAADGCVLVTTRKHTIAFQPAGAGIELKSFDPTTGLGFLLSLLRLDITQEHLPSETDFAAKVVQMASGHALAINNMAGVIHRYGWSLEEFLAFYERDAKKIERKASIDTIWKIQFQLLEKDTSMFILLGLMSFMMPDSIPEAMFLPSDTSSLPESLRFCEDRLDLFEILANLRTLALVTRDGRNKSLSIHRLVQSQFREYLGLRRAQETFELAVKLLNLAFPKRPSHSHRMHTVWGVCELYVQHVLSIMYIYKTEVKLRATQEFCELLAGAARYLCENGSYKELEQMLLIAERAVSEWEEGQNHPELLAELAFHNSVQWQQRGDFPLSFRHIEDAMKHLGRIQPPDVHMAIKLKNHRSMVLSCLKQHKDSYDEIVEVRELVENTQQGPIKSMLFMPAAEGRCLQFLLRYSEALALFKVTEQKYKEGVANWHNYSISLYCTGNIHRAEKRLVLAHETYLKTKRVLETNGSPTYEFVGVCWYKLGCVALERGMVSDAVDYLRHALTIAYLRREFLPAHVARAQFKLSQALRKTSDHGVEADDLASQAEQMYYDLTKELHFTSNFLSPPDPTCEEAFDNLIANWWR